jgi:hypothetical protein
MADSQIDRIRQAEKSVLEGEKKIAELREYLESIDIKDAETRTYLIEAAEQLEADIKKLNESLRAWREDIN